MSLYAARLRSVVAVFVLVVVAGCAEGELEAPPLFNAIDPSQACPTDQIGWDFSSGGGDTDIVSHNVSREIKVVQATFGGSCGAPQGNVTTDFALACDGKAQCVRKVQVAGSPTVSCSQRDFVVTYRCGEEPAVYEVKLPADAAASEVTLICGVQLTIVSATYAANQTPPPNGNLTRTLATACSGKRRCSLVRAPELFGSDPWPNFEKTTEVRYYCGGESVQQVKVFRENDRLDFFCSVETKPVPAGDSLRFRDVQNAPGTALPQAFLNDTLAALVRACDGKPQCTFPFPARPTTSGASTLEVGYWCGADQSPVSRTIFHQEYGTNVTFGCGQRLTITSATPIGKYGSLAAHLTSRVKALCDGKTICPSPKYKPLLPDGGSFDANVQIKYTCENLLGEFEHYFQYGQEVGAECPVVTTQFARGLRIESATRVTENDALIDVTNACFGRDFCKGPALSGVTVKYRCGESPELKTRTLTSGSQLDCRPVAEVLSTEGCPMLNDLTGYWEQAGRGRQQCTTQPGTCDWDFANALTYVRRGIACKSATVRYRCGADPTVKTATAGDGTTNVTTLPLVCETPVNPYVRKACVPKTCTGRVRRDQDLKCVTDNSKQSTSYSTRPLVKEWSPTAGAFEGNDVTALKEDVPYKVFAEAFYQTGQRTTLPATTATTIWAYDEFRLKAGERNDAGASLVQGFRCLVSTASVGGAGVTSNLPDFKKVLTGGKGAVLPPSCFRQDAVDDTTTSWYEGARRANLPEAQFRARYQLSRTALVGSFDVPGRDTTRLKSGTTPVAINPIGFFFDPKRQWIDNYSYYAQSASFDQELTVTMTDSKDIVLRAERAALGQAEIELSLQDPEVLPSFEVDLTWSLRGDSPTKNPLSGSSLLAPTAAQNLSTRNLRASIEISRADATWAANNTVQFPATRLGPGNAFARTDKLVATVSADDRRRLLAVRSLSPDGLMLSSGEELTVFNVRACVDFDGLGRQVGDTDIDDKKVTVARDGVTYSLGIGKRCTAAAPLVVRRDLFIRPTLPVASEEVNGDKASSKNQGNSVAATANDLASQSSCVRQCSSNVDCGGGTCVRQGTALGTCDNDSFSRQACVSRDRNSMGSSGQFGITLFSAQNDTSSVQSATEKKLAVNSSFKLLGFAVFDAAQNSTATNRAEIEVSVVPNIDEIIAAVKALRADPAKTDGKKTKNKRKAKKTTRKSEGSTAAKKKDDDAKFERDGVAMVLSKDFPFTVGPVPLVLEVGFSVGFGFSATAKLIIDRQTAANMNSPLYPCLGTSPCTFAYDEPKTFKDANDDCGFKGGRLAQLQTPQQLTAVATAVASKTAPEYWLGGQLAYLYTDPACANQASLRAECFSANSTQYSWLNGPGGGVPFARTNGQVPTLIEPNRYVGAHSFGAGSLGALVTRVPDTAGVLYRKATRDLSTALSTATRPYLCQFDAARSYSEVGGGIEVGAEFSAGVSAAVCTPNNKIGFCLGAELKFVTAAIKLEALRRSVTLYDQSDRRAGVIGTTSLSASWELAFLSGAISAELRFLFANKSWTIVSFDSLKSFEGVLFELDAPYRKGAR